LVANFSARVVGCFDKGPVKVMLDASRSLVSNMYTYIDKHTYLLLTLLVLNSPA
jgi:hypothetical protein